MHLQRTTFALLAAAACVSAHLEITYPGTRGNNLLDNHDNKTECVKGTMDDYDGARGCFPYGMQFSYPCGGLPTTTNRTKWPTKGGAVAFQPGWFSGHSTAFIYINLGIGTLPPNMSHPMVPVFQIAGPTNDPYPGRSICIPQVGMPANLSLTAGQNATIQIVEATKHGAALYACVDITLTDDMSEVDEVTRENCHNDTDSIDFNMIFTTISLTNAAPQSITPAFFILFSAAVSASIALLAI